MTLPTSKHLDEAHDLYIDHPKMHQAIRMIRESQHAATLASLQPSGEVLEAAAKAMYGHWFGWEPESLDSAWRKETPQARAVWVECAQSASRLLLADKEREVEELRGNVEYWQRTADRLAVANQTLLDGGTR